MNLSQIKREKMMAFLKKLKEENSGKEENLIAINEIENELNNKKYGLIWEEHEENVDKMMEDNVPVFVEDKKREIKTSEDEYNFLLEGDNLHSLYLLEKTHKGKIDIIYIDPPYNTGSEDFKYDDSYIENEDGFKHSKWLSFIHSRLLIAKSLLSNNGLIFISIDDNEYSTLNLLCDEIFGRNGYIATLHWKKKKQPSYLHGQVAGVMEYILVYAIDRNNIDKLSLSSPSDSNTRIDNASNQEAEREIKSGIRAKLPDCIIKAGKYKNKTMTTEYLSDVIIKNGRTQNKFKAIAKFRDSQERINLFCEQDVLFITKNYGFRRDKLKEELEKKKAITDLLLDWGDNQDSDKEIKEIFADKPFSYPKPVLLIKKLLLSTGYNNSNVLDFFAGSGTTAQAVLELNKEDGGNRHFILCTNNENNICEDVTYKRIKTVITGLRDDKSKYSDGISANLKYYKTDFVKKDTKNLSRDLSKHVKELIQLENGVDIDNDKWVMILTEEDAEKFEKNIKKYKNLKGVYRARSVVWTKSQKVLLKGKEDHIIPDYYFNNELKEVGENW